MSTHGQGKEFSGGNANAADLWSELIASEPHYHHQEPEIPIVYRRKNAHSSQNVAPSCQLSSSSGNENRVSWAPVKRFSWNRSLSTRGRTSIAVSACVNHKPQQGKPKRKARPPLPKGKVVQATYEKELTYFQEVDSFVLLEESPSPKNSSTWAMGIQSENVMSHLSSVLKKWLVTRKLNYSQGPSSTLSKILETPELNKEAMCDDVFDDSSLKTPEKGLLQMSSGLHSTQRNSPFGIKDVLESHMSSRKDIEGVRSLGEGNEDIEVAIHKLSLTSRLSSLESQRRDSLLALLTVCGQSSPTTLLDVFSKYCEPECIVKVGEGTYGEAFKAGQTVCKIVPFDGDLLVNGEVQKKSEELLEEVVLCLTLNRLRGHPEPVYNACTTFIQTLNLKVCQGPYDASLIYAWEQWDTKHGSENDHPKEFGEDQSYVVFVQEHGGQDLESFVLLNFDEARSLLVQVTVALAVAEAAFQFEHRDLHWGNILLSRKESALLEFTLEGRKINVRTFGLVISIIDFTLSRINTGEDILFLDLSSDPGLFEGPKGDKQFDTYRKMKEVTEECWEGSFPKTNVLWLQYLVDILLMKKSYDKNSKSDRDLRSLKKRLNNYGSAKEATSNPFFTDLFISDHVK